MRSETAQRFIAGAIACYPADWKQRHEEEALQVAGALRADGIGVSSIVLSYFAGAARERICNIAQQRLRHVVATLLISATLIGLPITILGSVSTAGATNTAHAISRTSNSSARQHLESLAKSSGVKFTVTVAP